MKGWLAAEEYHSRYPRPGRRGEDPGGGGGGHVSPGPGRAGLPVTAMRATELTAGGYAEEEISRSRGTQTGETGVKDGHRKAHPGIDALKGPDTRRSVEAPASRFHGLIL